MSRRLDRLMQLLAAGSNPVIRAHAAEQIGEIQREQPQLLSTLISQLQPYLRSAQWSTRIAAADALRIMCRHVQQHMDQMEAAATSQEESTPKCTAEPATSSSSAAMPASASNAATLPLLSLSAFSTSSVIEKGTHMLSSSGREYTAASLAHLPPGERIASQRRELLKRLGCHDQFASFTGAEANALLQEADVEMQGVVTSEPAPQASAATPEPLTEMSARERNKARRDAKRRPHNDAREIEEESDQPSSKRSKLLATASAAPADADLPMNALLVESVVDESSGDDSSLFVRSDGSHVLMPFVSRMLWQLLDAEWEVRHGAALALRSVLMHLVSRLGCDLRLGLTASQRESSVVAHQVFLSDTCARVLCVLLLDRFGDYTSERTSCPVREAATQMLALLATELDDHALQLLVSNLLQMAERRDGELRYGAFIGLKYVLTVRFAPQSALLLEPEPNVNVRVLRAVLDPLIAALQDASDDVRGMVADSLMAVVTCIAASSHDASLLISEKQFSTLLSALWSTLLLCDDLTSSTMQTLELLRTMYEWIAESRSSLSPANLPNASAKPAFFSASVVQLPLSTLLARLFPFLAHSFLSVKVNTWKTVLTLVRLELSRGAVDLSQLPILASTLRLAYQSLVLESDDALHAICFAVVDLFTAGDLTHAAALSDPQYQEVFNAIASPCLDLLLSPLFQPLPPRLLLRVEQQSGGSSHGIAVAHEALGGLVAGSNQLVSSLDMKLRMSRAFGMIMHRLASCATKDTSTSCLALPSDHFKKLLLHLQSPHDLFVQMSCLVLCEWWSRAPTHPASWSIACYPDWLNTLQSLTDPALEPRTRSANTKSILTQALIQACEVRAQSGDEFRATFFKCTPPLLVTLETERNFEPLQQRCAQYLSKQLRMLVRSNVKTERAVKLETEQDDSSDRLLADDTIARMIDMLCSTLPAPAPAPAAIPSRTTAVKVEQPVEDEELSASDEALLAMLQDDDEPAPVAAAASKPPPSAPAPRVASSRSKKVSADVSSAREVVAALPSEVQPPVSIPERGARLFLTALCQQCDSAAEGVFGVFPTLWKRHVAGGLSTMHDSTTPTAHTALDRYAIVRSLHVLLHLLPDASTQCHSQMLTVLPAVQRCLFVSTDGSPDGLVELSSLACRVLVSFAKTMTTACMEALLRDLLPVLSAASHDPQDAEAKVSVLTLLQSLYTDLAVPLIPYLPFFLVPALSCMSSGSSSPGSADVDERIRSAACALFGTLMTLIPLEAGIASPPDMSPQLQAQRLERRAFLRQLTDGSQVPEVSIPSGLLATGVVLRKYQRDGITWLLFLQRFHLHGVLCDEMGVGKTLQAIVMLAMSVHERRLALQRELNGKSASSSSAAISSPFAPLPSLILCPATLLHHWAFEFQKFIDPAVCLLNLVVYQGNASQRTAIRQQLLQAIKPSGAAQSSAITRDSVVIMSYDSIRSDAAHFAGVTFHHLILDEGHLLRSGSSAVSRAVKSLRSLSRLVLTGTPLSNHVVELWSLFDFLMPGYLGSQADFSTTFARPIQKARSIELERPSTGAKGRQSTEADAQSARQQAITSAGNMALEQLHRRVLPFLLRRLKSDVLADLPPKTVQDVVVDLSPLQRDLYQLIQGQESQVETQAEAMLQGATPSAAGDAPQMHTFQALNYMRKLCSHPALVFSAQHPQYRELKTKHLSGAGESIRSLKHAPKLGALKELLLECGIGTSCDAATNAPEGSVDVDSLLEHANQRDQRSSKRKKASSKATSAAALSGVTSIDSILPRQRVLVFAQLKATLDRVEQDLFNASGNDNDGEKINPDGFTPGSVSFLRMDGSTPPARRFALAHEFNNSPHIGVLLLTTRVGGLGLNLTGASTVVFLEPDWNPQVDLQAMDRAHRIGQRASCVHVYRLLSRGTIESRVMSVQRFKVHVAQSVVNLENASMDSMETAAVLDRFEATAAATASNATIRDVDDDEQDNALASFLANAHRQ